MPVTYSHRESLKLLDSLELMSATLPIGDRKFIERLGRDRDEEKKFSMEDRKRLGDIVNRRSSSIDQRGRRFR